MKAYRIELFVIDFDGQGADEIKTVIENARYPNRCIDPSVQAIEGCDIGKWYDDHPLNKRDSFDAEYARLFAAQPSADLQAALDNLAAQFSQPYMEYFGEQIQDAIRALRSQPAAALVASARPSAAPMKAQIAVPDTPELRYTLKEIALCYPCGTGRKLVRDGSSLDWISCRESTGSMTMLADFNNNMVNSAIAATVAHLAAPCLPERAPEGWISVDVQLPGEQGHDSEEVMCFLSGHCASTDSECRQGAGWGIRLGYYDAEKGMFRTHGRLDASVTHWMPLPTAPTPGAK